LEITTVLCDVGGVVLTNGWDHDSRRLAAEKFGLDWDEFCRRHDPLMPDFDCGRLTLDEYLGQTVFCRPRVFSAEEFEAFMYAQSRPYPEARAVVSQLAATGRYFMTTLNNEPLELNRYRIARFGLRELFTLFFSSCFLGARKPEPAVYRAALDVMQRTPEECLFIDDRAGNVEAARAFGMRTIHYLDAGQLRDELKRHGIALP